MPAYRLANAPCSWGVDFADRPENPDWRRVLDEVAAAGFSAIDLGPVGYFPPDPSQLADELAKRNLSLSAGGLFDPLADPAAFDGVIGKTRRTCAISKRSMRQGSLSSTAFPKRAAVRPDDLRRLPVLA